MIHKKTITVFVTFAVLAMMLSSLWLAYAVPATPVLLDPKSIPKYVNQLVTNIPVYTPTVVADPSSPSGFRNDYTVNMVALDEEILPVGTPTVGGTLGPNGAPLTHVWGYQGLTNIGMFANSPSATFIATRGTPSRVTWVNSISEPQFLPVDPTIHWADPTAPAGTMTMWNTPYPAFPGTFTGTAMPGNIARTLNAQTPVPLVPHLHGAEVQSYFDGGPEAWWTYNGYTGSTYSTNVYNYPNAQNPTTLWYHDHALGMTRLNVMSGLAGFYLLKDSVPSTPITTVTANNFDAYLSQHFPYGVSEIPLAIQDRSFYANGQLWFPTVGINPTIHPYWMPEFFGNTIMVNGKVWPNLDVSQGWYRFRVLDGSNARFYTISLKDPITGLKLPFTVIGSDGGYLRTKATVGELTMAPGERYDILVDFSAIPVGTKLIMTNTANAPFPGGKNADPQTVGQIMQFTVKATAPANPGSSAPVIPTSLNPTLPGTTFPIAFTPAVSGTRVRTLFEVQGPAGPLMVTVNGQTFDGVLTETPKNGTTEDWVIVNLTADTHPIHTHLATFQLVSRQAFQVNAYMKDWLALNAPNVPPFPTNYSPKPLDPTPYLTGKATTALPSEMGWKDTIQMPTGMVTIIRIRFTQQDGTKYPFDPAQGPGYVWHCHIVDHEDNEMMRPYTVAP